ncbi:hypothetical protein PoB_005495400 [Plakobranchus ocellatus]|uniref:Uncharacterized protein n=1 Tax=Plakobranchus ocellatus TaxID=259542 RepID=A0AAV4CBI6_9GAST|nr:hypothetical protein PoB_005495400 [Plakobranchus ocellatus]
MSSVALYSNRRTKILPCIDRVMLVAPGERRDTWRQGTKDARRFQASTFCLSLQELSEQYSVITDEKIEDHEISLTHGNERFDSKACGKVKSLNRILIMVLKWDVNKCRENRLASQADGSGKGRRDRIEIRASSAPMSPSRRGEAIRAGSRLGCHIRHAARVNVIISLPQTG